jgi:hypothetical protein
VSGIRLPGIAQRSPLDLLARRTRRKEDIFMKEFFEISGSVANFIGGVVLLIDALRMRGNLKIKAGGNAFQRALDAEHVTEPLRDTRGNSLATEEARELWLAIAPLVRSWIGFGLLAIGFGCEITSHFFR